MSFNMNLNFWKCNFPMNHNVCLSVCPLVCLSVQKKIFLLNFEMSEFSVNVFLYFFLKSPPHPYPCFNMKRGEKIILKEFKSYLFH